MPTLISIALRIAAFSSLLLLSLFCTSLRDAAARAEHNMDQALAARKGL